MLRSLATVRARTTLAATAVVLLALMVASVLLVTTLRRTLVRGIEAAARVRVDDLLVLARQGTLPPTPAIRGEEDALVQVVGADGTVIAASQNLAGQAPISDRRPPVGSSDAFTIGGQGTEGDDVVRVVAETADLPGGPATVYAGSTLDRVEETVHTVGQVLVVGVPVLGAIVGLTTWYLVGWALRPVEAIRAEVADISARNLDRRVPVPPTDDEIGRLARTMNQTLDRLSDAAERQQRFVADASHELQSPVAAAQTLLDVALAHPDDTDWPEVASDLLDEHRRIERLLRDLLFLARAEAGGLVVVPVPLDLDRVVQAEVARLPRRAGIRVDATGVLPAEVRGDADQLGRAVRNLLENARRYASAVVSVEVREAARWVEVVVTDDGPGVAPADRERVFERFARTDDARSRTTGGTGLGLAIVREVAASHGGTVIVADSGAGAVFVLRLPSPWSNPTGQPAGGAVQH